MFELDYRNALFTKYQSLWLDTSMVYGNQADAGFRLAYWAIQRATYAFWWGNHAFVKIEISSTPPYKAVVMAPSSQETKDSDSEKQEFCDLEYFAHQPSDRDYRLSFVTYQMLDHAITRYTPKDSAWNIRLNNALSTLIIGRRLLSRIVTTVKEMAIGLSTFLAYSTLGIVSGSFGLMEAAFKRLFNSPRGKSLDLRTQFHFLSRDLDSEFALVGLRLSANELAALNLAGWQSDLEYDRETLYFTNEKSSDFAHDSYPAAVTAISAITPDFESFSLSTWLELESELRDKPLILKDLEDRLLNIAASKPKPSYLSLSAKMYILGKRVFSQALTRVEGVSQAFSQWCGNVCHLSRRYHNPENAQRSRQSMNLDLDDFQDDSEEIFSSSSLTPSQKPLLFILCFFRTAADIAEARDQRDQRDQRDMDCVNSLYL